MHQQFRRVRVHVLFYKSACTRTTAAANKLREKPTMYGKGGVAGPVVATTTTVGVLTLPNTGGNIVISLAIAVASGLVVWGVMYARSAR